MDNSSPFLFPSAALEQHIECRKSNNDNDDDDDDDNDNNNSSSSSNNKVDGNKKKSMVPSKSFFQRAAFTRGVQDEQGGDIQRCEIC